MKREYPQYFDLIKEYFLTQFSFFSNNNPPRVNIRDWNSIHSKNIESTLINFVIEITIDNLIGQREIFLSYYHGYSANVTLCNDIVFEIKNTSKNSTHSRKNFFIGDFCEFYDIELSEPSFYETTGESYSLEKLKKYTDAVKSIIENTNLKEILEGKIWIDIPVNMKPYK